VDEWQCGSGWLIFCYSRICRIRSGSGFQELDHTERLLKWAVYASPLVTLTTDLGLSICVFMFEQVNSGLGSLLRSPGMGDGRDWWSWPSRVDSQCLPVCSNPRIFGIPPISFQYKLYFQKSSDCRILASHMITRLEGTRTVTQDHTRCRCALGT